MVLQKETNEYFSLWLKLINIAHSIRKKILQYTGLPVSIGIGKTKTLAKVANYVSKKELKYKQQRTQEMRLPFLQQHQPQMLGLEI